MKNFFESNPGLKSRFNTFIEFEDYSSNELESILESMCKDNDYIVEESAKVKIRDYLSKAVSEKGENFSNARMVRNLYDDLVMNHARRVVDIKNPGREILSTIIEGDFSIT
jgi:hypothetical protein